MSDLLSTVQAAEYLGCSLPLVKRHAKLGSIGRLVGKTYVFTRAELAAWKRRKRPTGRPKA